MYTKTHEVMLEKEIKKLKKDFKELREMVSELIELIRKTQDAALNRKITEDGK
jgi:hypothetical protein